MSARDIDELRSCVEARASTLSCPDRRTGFLARGFQGNIGEGMGLCEYDAKDCEDAEGRLHGGCGSSMRGWRGWRCWIPYGV